MRIRTGLIAAVLITMTVAGCSATSPVTLPTSAPSSTPVFASEDEALAAATAAYADYLKATDAIGASGGNGAPAIEPFVTASQLSTELAGFKQIADADLRTSGSTKFRNSKIQARDYTGKISMYVCVDSSNLRVLNGKGTDVTPASRKNEQTIVVKFEARPDGPSGLLVDGVTPWSGTSIC